MFYRGTHRADPNTNPRAITALAVMALLLIVGMVTSATSASAAAKPAPKPVATWVGAHSVTNDPGNWATMNTLIGPLKTQRIFYTTLPVSYSADTSCSSLPSNVMCVVSYQTPNTNVVSYLKSIPASRQVQITWYHEPEDPSKGFTGASYVSQFKMQSALIRSANIPNVQISMIAELFEYRPGGHGVGCGFIPPASSVDHYLADLYDPDGTLARNDLGLKAWMACTLNKGPTRGLAEWGVGPDSCIKGSTRNQVMASDITYFRSVFPKMFMLEYWWVDNSSVAPCRNWQFNTNEDAGWMTGVK